MISIIIPTLNEALFLRNTVDDILKKAKNPKLLQIIVVDAGSNDGTIDSVYGLNICTFSKPSFQFKKYESLNFGISKAEGNHLLFLDADTALPQHFDQSIIETLSNSKVVGGAFEFSFLESDLKFKFIEILNSIRYTSSKLYYGDQAMFCRKDAAIKVGGFPQKRLMETAYFCQELKKIGRLSLVKTPVKTSARRFIKNGYIKVCWFDFTMWLRFILHLSVEEYGVKYWSANLQSNE